MSFSLNTTIIEPEENSKIQNILILLHGYGGDGKDISSLALNMRRHVKKTIFLCPDANQKCSINPSGFQWFDLTVDDKDYILDESIKSELLIKKYISEISSHYKVPLAKICISGFSQGCMMSLSVGLTSNEKFNSIVGYSGKILDQENLSKRISSKTKVLLFHGELDTVVHPSNLLAAKDFLQRKKIEVETNLLKNCEHSIPVEAVSSTISFLNRNLIIL
ncbi:MAG: serine esterase [Candidatus Pelagibacter sp. TMED275]|nr:MAG: serine esterase [Candidatus Pelagibacter sp. TMED275]